MKTAIEWAEERFGVDSDWVKQIQLDAIREGMRFAAEIADAAQNRYNTVKDAKTSILEAAEKLTEKDL